MEWPPVVVALSTAVIALVQLLLLGVVVMLARQAMQLVSEATRVVGSLETQARPAIDSAKAIVTDVSQAATKLRGELDSWTEASTDVRERVLDAIDNTGERLEDLGALLDVIQEEVEETVLDVGAALRTTRRSTSVLRAMKRALLGRGRRRR